MSRLTACVAAVLLAVMPVLSHTCDVGCDSASSSLELATAAASVPADAADECPLHAAQAEDTSSSSDGQSSPLPAPCDHDGHDQAVSADVVKAVRQLTPLATAHVTPVRLEFLATSPTSFFASVDRPDRAFTAVTTRPVLRI